MKVTYIKPEYYKEQWKNLMQHFLTNSFTRSEARRFLKSFYKGVSDEEIDMCLDSLIEEGSLEK